jgi:hypothetical protein
LTLLIFYPGRFSALWRARGENRRYFQKFKMAPKGSSANGGVWALSVEESKRQALAEREARALKRGFDANVRADQAADAEAARNIRVAAHDKFGNVKFVDYRGIV